ncbi:MAG: hypothetical protein COB86_09430 [Dehalococcoidia bacterium]|nr:MAG: hypothetical protein COB86_09430 [Dehalococcoidia bacterium]
MGGAVQRRIGGQIGHQPQGKTRILRLGDRWQRPRRAHHGPICRPRGGRDVIVIEKGGIGGQAGTTERIDNYPGFVEGIVGGELAEQMQAHAERFGVEIPPAQTVTGIMTDGDHKLITTESGDEYCSNAVLLAPGTRYRRLGVPGEEDMIGAGIHFCATCDGPFYKDQEVVVVGGGNSGVEEGLFLTKFATKVTVIEFNDQLGASQILREKADSHPKMEIKLGKAVQEFKGTGHLESIIIQDRAVEIFQEELRQEQPHVTLMCLALIGLRAAWSKEQFKTFVERVDISSIQHRIDGIGFEGTKRLLLGWCDEFVTAA